ncbi:MAG: amidohydrolase [Holophagaceae bacterium]|nr:amidohydrolase [Holophagaceae bacterium]
MLMALPPPSIVLLMGADIWLDDGRIAGARTSQAVALRGPRIVAVGPVAQLVKRYPKASKVELKGGTLLPAFTEGHAHVGGLGTSKLEVDLSGTKDAKEAADRVLAWSTAHANGWLKGRGWDQNRWPGKSFPAASQLDAVSGNRPAFLVRVDGHAAWVNSAALRLAGISATTPDPKGGRILRGEKDDPSGILVDSAVDLVSKLIPMPTESERREQLLEGLRELRNEGFAAVSDMGVSLEELAAYRALALEGALPIRVFAYLGHDPKLLLQELKHPRSKATSFFQVQGVKFYMDGALGSRGARLNQPYSDEKTTSGLWVTEPGIVERDAITTTKAGYQPAIHAIGDAANRKALDILAAAQKSSPGAMPPRVEHAQIVDPADASRFGKLGIIASVQPVHCTSDHAWTPARLGPARVHEAFPWRTFLKGGAVLAFGSDAPVEGPNPYISLAAAETREDPEGDPPGGFLPDQKLTRTEALRAYTLGNARALGRQDMGSIKKGAVADLLWVQAPILALSPAELRRLRPGRMWVNGAEVSFSNTPSAH